MPDPADVLAAFREELIELGSFRRPSEAGPDKGPPYPVVIEPLEGAPAPGELEGNGVHGHRELVVTLLLSSTLGERAQDAATRARRVIDVRYRTAGTNVGVNPSAILRQVMALDAAIGRRLIRSATHYGYGFELGTNPVVFVHEAAPWAGLSPIERSRERGFDHVAKWLLETAP